MWPTRAAWWPKRTSSIGLPPVRMASIQFRTCARVESSSFDLYSTGSAVAGPSSGVRLSVRFISSLNRAVVALGQEWVE